MNTAYFNYFLLDLPDDCVTQCSAAGAVDEAVAWWTSLIDRPEYLTPKMIALELRESGAWSAEELSDDSANWRRIIWLAACNIQEERQSLGTRPANP